MPDVRLQRWYRVPVYWCIVLCCVSASAQQADPTFTYSFAAVARVTENERQQVLPLTDRMSLQSGSLLKFYLEPTSDGFAYCYHEDEAGRITVLMPDASRASRVRKGAGISIPEGDSWIRLDSVPGKETFHLIVSPNRIERLESLNLLHLSPADRGADASPLIRAEIGRLKRETFRKVSEKPVRIAGQIRAPSFTPPMNSGKEVTVTGVGMESLTLFHE